MRAKHAQHVGLERTQYRGGAAVDKRAENEMLKDAAAEAPHAPVSGVQPAQHLQHPRVAQQLEVALLQSQQEDLRAATCDNQDSQVSGHVTFR